MIENMTKSISMDVDSNNNNQSIHYNNERRSWSMTPFPINRDMNEQVEIIDTLDYIKAEALVSPTNENFTYIQPSVECAGRDLKNHLRHKFKTCPTGEVRLSPGFKSGFKHIIHAVPPKFQSKYKTAAESALFHTYFKVLQTVVEKQIKSVVMMPLTLAKTNYPSYENANMHLRIIRRFLEKKLYVGTLKIYIFVPDNDCKVHYEYLFPVYFPLTPNEEEAACYKLDTQIGGPNGEPVIPERTIRIAKRPFSLDDSVDLKSGLDLSVAVGQSPFGKMFGDIDKTRRARRELAMQKTRQASCLIL